MVKKRVLQAQEAIQGEKMIEVKLRFWQVAEKLKNTAPFRSRLRIGTLCSQPLTEPRPQGTEQPCRLFP
jgi:hypothetical protein